MLLAEEIRLILNVRGLPAVVQIFYYFCAPILAGVIICLLINKLTFKLRKDYSKDVIYTLLLKIGIVVIFLLLGLILEGLNARNRLSNYLNGTYTEVIAGFVTSLNVYIIISLFPLSYGVTEFLLAKK